GVYLGRHQRCWVHRLRDLHALKDKHPDDPSVGEWGQAVKQVYDRAKAWKPPRPNSRFEERDRHHAQGPFEAELRALAPPLTFLNRWLLNGFSPSVSKSSSQNCSSSLTTPECLRTTPECLRTTPECLRTTPECLRT